MESMELYNKFKEVPEEAKKKIEGGKLKNFTDINPMWRIKSLTEVFGPCGIGWRAPIVEEKIIPGANGEVVVVIKINLLYKYKGEWSEPIEGTGGSMLVKLEQGKLTTNDEAFKMAYTDAISVAFKMIGGGADVYYEKDRTKYDLSTQEPKEKQDPKPQKEPKTTPKKQETTPTRTDTEILKSIIINNPLEAHIVKDIIDTEYNGKPSRELTEEECQAILDKLENCVMEEKKTNE